MDRDEILRVLRAFEAAGLEYVRCARFWKLAPRVYPRGVFKFRSVEDMRHPDR